MKKQNFKWILVLLAAMPMLFFASCEEDEPMEPGNEFQPVKDVNFFVSIEGNYVTFTTTMTGGVWVTTSGVDYTMVDQEVVVHLPNMGTYSFTCSSIGSGETLTSDPFDVEITDNDNDFLNHGLWKYLSGGADQTKTWKMDMSEQHGGSIYFAGPVFYSGDENGPYWAWDVTDTVSADNPYTATLDDGSTKEFTSIFNWSPDYAGNTWLMAAQDYGTITFDGTNGTVSTSVFGETVNGTFTFDTVTLKMGFTGGIKLPIDTARLNEPQFVDEDLANVRIFSLTDSAMQIGIKRTYEGFDTDGVTQIESRWTMIYNFIVDGYDYPIPEEFTYSEPVDTDYAGADLVGTWKYAPVPFDWVSWLGTGNQGTILDPMPLNNWATPADMIATDWLGLTQADLDAAANVELVFGGDGSCTIQGLATTYTLDAGVITFADSVGLTVGAHWFTFGGTSIKILDGVTGTSGTGDIWIGNQNEAKNESSSFHIQKQ